MDYINYVKQQPITGMTGFGGGATSLAWHTSGGGGGSGTWYGDRGTFAGGYGPNTVTIDYIDITSTGNASGFADLPQAVRASAPASNGTRGLVMGGRSASPGPDTQINYFTFGTTGTASDFGDSVTNAGIGYASGAAGSTGRALLAGCNGTSGTVDIEYFTIASTGNGTDLADLTRAHYGLAGCSNGTRAVFGGGKSGFNTIDYKAIDTTADCVDFGNLDYGRGYIGAAQSDPAGRGIFSGGENNAGIDYITIASASNASDFGDSSGNETATGCTSNATRGIIAGNYNPDADHIKYITIANTGNSSDFGDLSRSDGYVAACSGD